MLLVFATWLRFYCVANRLLVLRMGRVILIDKILLLTDPSDPYKKYLLAFVGIVLPTQAPRSSFLYASFFT